MLGPSMGVRAIISRRPVASAFLASCVVGLLGFGAYWFAPHKLVLDDHASDAPPDGMAVLKRGEFRSLEHSTTGRAALVALPDGRRVLRLEGLQTSNGPELRVLLSSVAAQDDWFVYDDGPFVDLGPLKGNRGSSNYEVPSDADLSKLVSAVVWCKRFSVGFGVAALDAAPDR
jgi:hypothetical protein